MGYDTKHYSLMAVSVVAPQGLVLQGLLHGDQMVLEICSTIWMPSE